MFDRATQIRHDAIAHVLALRARWVAVPASELLWFESGGERISLKATQGIFKPRQLAEPLSVTTTLGSPYADEVLDGRKIRYNFAPPSRDYENDGLKRAAEYELPLIHLLQLKGKPNPEYEVFAPVYVAAWDDASRTFVLDLSGERPAEAAGPVAMDVPPLQIREIVKGYLTTPVERRIHQARFRSEVLVAYRERCAVCVLRLRPLLDAAHIIPDVDPKPTIVVNEGMALCATHHRAFDAHYLRYDSSYRVRIDIPSDAIHEGEESMLLAFDGRPLTLPKDERFWPVVLS